MIELTDQGRGVGGKAPSLLNFIWSVCCMLKIIIHFGLCIVIMITDTANTTQSIISGYKSYALWY